jgi:nucleoside-diphosphate-sugar epimerase
MIFLTGATGLVGSFLLKKLLENGHRIKALKREDSDLNLVEDVYNQVEWVNGDLLDAPMLDKELVNVDTVFHCAALVSFDGRDKELLEDINVKGTENIVNASLINQVRNMVHISSVAAIGRSKQNEFITEDKKWERSSYNSAYAESKYKAELEAWRGQEEGLNVIVVNPSVILGPADWNKTSTRIFKLAYNQNRFYSGGTMNYIDVRDLVESIYGLFENNKFGERFILSAGHITDRELMTKIASGFNKRPPKIKANYFLLVALVYLEKIRSWISGNKPKITSEVLRLSRSNFVYDNSKVKRELGIVFRSIEDTVSWSCQELLKQP